MYIDAEETASYSTYFRLSTLEGEKPLVGRHPPAAALLWKVFCKIQLKFCPNLPITELRASAQVMTPSSKLIREVDPRSRRTYRFCPQIFKGRRLRERPLAGRLARGTM